MNFLSKLEWRGRPVPIVLQVEAAECGLACLSMVAAFHGHRIDLASMRSRFSVSLRGANLMQLISIAESLDMSCRPIRLDLEEIGELKRPCILHWDMNHYVVLAQVDRRGVVIHDPAYGKRHITYDDLGKHFTGVALELEPAASFRPQVQERRVSIRALLGETRGIGRAMALIFVMAVALEALALLSPLFNQWVVDEALVSNDRGLLNALTIGFALLIVIQTGISIARSWSVVFLATHLNLQWVSNVFTHMLRLPMNWFERRHLGDVVSRFGSISSIQRTITNGFIETVLDGSMGLLTGAMMMLYSGRLAAIVLLSVVLYGALRVLSFAPLRAANAEGMVLSARAQSYLLETIRGVQAIKLFGREVERRTSWLNLTVDSVNRDIRTQRFMLWFGIANTLIFGLEKLLVFSFGARMVLDNEFTVGMLFAFSSYQGQFTSRMGSLIDKVMDIRMLALHGERLADIVLEPPENSSETTAQRPAVSPRIELVNVGYRYSDYQPWVLKDISLTIEPGESVALVGGSGCGKTTLVKLILGLVKPTVGEVRCGGVPIDSLGQRAYRQVVAAVMQDDQLLSGSLSDNISFFDTDIDQERVERCARVAQIHDDIMSMPMAYHTLTGDMGTTLSGGQKQRVLLARALYKAPGILVLDEATSHLDVRCERLVNDAVRGLEMTRISVAHRPETIAMADRIVIMHGGHIVEDTPHSPIPLAGPAGEIPVEIPCAT